MADRAEPESLLKKALERDRELTSDEVLALIDYVLDCDPIIVGGQSINLWAMNYRHSNSVLRSLGALTSQDLDFHRNPAAVERLLGNLVHSEIYVPSAADVAPVNAAVVAGLLNGVPVSVDFMNSILGVEERSICNNFVGISLDIEGRATSVTLLLMHPLDCLRSRLANINLLHRHDRHAQTQQHAAVEILKSFLSEILDAGERKATQAVLRDIEFVVRNKFIGTMASRLEHTSDPTNILRHFLDDNRLDPRWREQILRTAINRLERKHQVAARRGRITKSDAHVPNMDKNQPAATDPVEVAPGESAAELGLGKRL